MITHTLHWNAQEGKYDLIETSSLQEDKRFQRALTIASVPENITKVSKALWKVKSQSKDSQTYIVTTLPTTHPTCTCKDFENGFVCKHIRGVLLHATYRSVVKKTLENTKRSIQSLIKELLAILSGSETDPDKVNNTMRLYAAAIDIAREPRRDPDELKRITKFQLRYWWPDWNPETLLDPTAAPALDDEARDLEVWSPGQGWRPPTQDLNAIRDFIQDQDLEIGPPVIQTNRRNGRWEGYYTIPIYQVLNKEAA